jgi:transposase-like protein
MRISRMKNLKDYTCDSCGVKFDDSVHVVLSHSARATDLCDRCATKVAIELLRFSRYNTDDI